MAKKMITDKSFPWSRKNEWGRKYAVFDIYFLFNSFCHLVVINGNSLAFSEDSWSWCEFAS